MFAFPRHDSDPIEFHETQLMLNYSRAVILEGDDPTGSARRRERMLAGSHSELASQHPGHESAGAFI
jgi:hypothetical protein